MGGRVRAIITAALFAVTLLALTRADAAESALPSVDPSIGKVEVTLDLPKDKPYVGEMILLRMRSFIRADIVLDEVIQPPLINFDWQQLGRDKPIEAMIDGFQVTGIERDLAIFPQQAGRLIIDPFVRKVTIVNNDNQRLPAEFSSKPVFVDVQNDSAVAPAGSWWLPAKSLTLTDTWSAPPDEIAPGTLSRRTIMLEAVGLTADRLPPAPEVMAPGTIVFRGPAKRETIITEDGPVARATYVWDIRPVSVSPARLPAISIPWFDTSERRMREAAIPETWVAYVGTLVHPSHERTVTFAETYLRAVPVTAGLVGFAWTAGFVGLLATRRRPTARARGLKRLLAALERRARYRDEPGLRNALADLALHEPQRWREVSTMPRVASRLAAFDAARYGRVGGEPPPLPPLAADIVRLWRAVEDEGAETARLPSLDGDASRHRAGSRHLWRWPLNVSGTDDPARETTGRGPDRF